MIELLAGLGLGSVPTTVLQVYLSRKDRAHAESYRERRDAYIGLEEAIYPSEVDPTSASALGIGHWAARCELMAPASVREAVALFIKSEPGTQTRRNAIQSMRAAMRKDLGVSD